MKHKEIKTVPILIFKICAQRKMLECTGKAETANSFPLTLLSFLDRNLIIHLNNFFNQLPQVALRDQ